MTRIEKAKEEASAIIQFHFQNIIFFFNRRGQYISAMDRSISIMSRLSLIS